MKLEAKTEIQISKPAHEVFEAVIDPGRMSEYFITKGSGRLEEGRVVTWSWKEYNTELHIEVKRIVENKFISFQWTATEIKTIVDLNFHSLTDQTSSLHIREHGWDKDDEGIANLTKQLQGWVFFAVWLKGYMEYNIDLRTIVL